jgi:hypothetical protein
MLTFEQWLRQNDPEFLEWNPLNTARNVLLGTALATGTFSGLNYSQPTAAAAEAVTDVEKEYLKHTQIESQIQQDGSILAKITVPYVNPKLKDVNYFIKIALKKAKEKLGGDPQIIEFKGKEIGTGGKIGKGNTITYTLILKK